MTINKKLGFSLVAATMLSTSAMAICTLPGSGTDCTGNLNVSQGGTISAELLAVSDVNVSVANFTFTPHFSTPSTRNNPVFEFSVTPTNVTGDLTGHAIYEINASGEYNSSNPITKTGTITNGVVSFGVLSGGGGSVKSASNYAILSINPATAPDGNATDPLNFAKVDLLIKTAADAASTSVCANVYTGDTGAFLSGACKTPLYTVVPEYKIIVDKEFNRRLDLCSGRIVFDTTSGGCGSDDNKTDRSAFQIVRTDVTYPFVDNNKSAMRIHADQNLSVIAIGGNVNANTAGTTMSPTVTASPMIILNAASTRQDTVLSASSLKDATNVARQSLTVVYEVNTSAKIPDTKFDWEFILSMTDASGKEHNTSALGSLSKGNLGEWKPFGYAAQIPNVSVNTAAAVESTMIVTNTGDKTAEVFFTLVGAGVECQVDTLSNPTLNAIPANSIMKYTASTLLAACPSIGVDTATFGLELDIAVNPQDIYTHASFRNKSSGTALFKDLPVYNTSSMSY